MEQPLKPISNDRFQDMSIDQLECEIDCLKQDLRLFADDWSIAQHIRAELDQAEEVYYGRTTDRSGEPPPF